MTPREAADAAHVLHVAIELASNPHLESVLAIPFGLGCAQGQVMRGAPPEAKAEFLRLLHAAIDDGWKCGEEELS